MRPPVGAGAQARFFQHRKVGNAGLCCDTRDVLGVHDHAQTDADAVMECPGIGQAQIDAAVATAPLVRFGTIETRIVLPRCVVESNHVALKRHPIAHRLSYLGLPVLGSLAPMSLVAPSLLLICHTPSGVASSPGLPEISWPPKRYCRSRHSSARAARTGRRRYRPSNRARPWR